MNKFDLTISDIFLYLINKLVMLNVVAGNERILFLVNFIKHVTIYFILFIFLYKYK
jgi:hypothetical protein